MTWQLLLVPSAPGLVVAFLLLAAWIEDRTLEPRPAVVRQPPAARPERRAGSSTPA